MDKSVVDQLVERRAVVFKCAGQLLTLLASQLAIEVTADQQLHITHGTPGLLCLYVFAYLEDARRWCLPVRRSMQRRKLSRTRQSNIRTAPAESVISSAIRLDFIPRR